MASKSVTFSTNVDTFEFVDVDALQRMNTQENDRARFYEETLVKHKHVPIKSVNLKKYPASKIPCMVDRQISKYIDKLKQYDQYYATHYIKLNKFNKQERRIDSRRYKTNRAILKLTEMCKQSEYYGQPLYELGCPPGKFLKNYEQVHKVRVFGCGLFSRIKQDLQPDQMQFFNTVREEGRFNHSMYIFDQDATCEICLNATKKIVTEECVKIVLSDMGYSINYNSPPFNWFMYMIYLLKLFKDQYVDVIVKVQQFGATINHYKIFPNFLKVCKLLGYSLSFHKPSASWIGNDEIYIFAKKAIKPKIDYLSLSEALDEMTIYRTDVLKKFKSSLQNGC
jgi:hypothetical protein